MFLDYFLKAFILLTGIYLWDFVFVRLKNDYDLEIHNLRIAKKDFGLQLDIRYSGVEINDLIWNFTRRTLKLDNMDLWIKYSKLKNILTLENTQVHFGMADFDFDLDLKDAYSGKLRIAGKDKNSGTLQLGYESKNNHLEFKKKSGNLEISSLKYKIGNADDLKITLNEDHLNIDAKNLSVHGTLGDSLVKIEVFLNTQLAHGHCMVKIGKKNRLKFNLKKLDVITLIQEIASSGGESDSSIGFSSFRVHGYSEKTVFQNKQLLHNASLNAELDYSKIKHLHLEAEYSDHAKVTATSDGSSIISIESESAANIFNLFIPPVIRGGSLTGNIDLQRMTWDFVAKDIKFPTLSNIQVKHIISPLRWVRLLFSDPSYIQTVSGTGRLMSNCNYIKIEKIYGSNSYYYVLVKGFVDLGNDKMNINGSIGSTGMFSQKTKSSESEDPQFHDDISFYIKGNLEEPEFKYTVAPWTVISTIFQPFMY